MANKNETIYSYLFSGYDMTHITEFVLSLPNCELRNSAYNAKEAAALFDKIMDEIFNEYTGFRYCVIPISGGWDSRILLGAAMERLEKKQIKTYTFGIPGLQDYEIGKQIAKQFDLEHHLIDLSSIELKWNELLESVAIAPWTFVPDAFFNHLSYSRIASEKDIVLSGVRGGPLTGGHFSSAVTLKDAKDEFLARQQRQKALWLLPDNYDITGILPECKEDITIPYSKILDFGIRQSNCIASIVTPQKQWTKWGVDTGVTKNGTKVIAPYSHSAWAAYWLKVPDTLLLKQKLYRQMLAYKYPKLANMPSKYYYGYRYFDVRFLIKKCFLKADSLGIIKFPQITKIKTCMNNYLDYEAAFRKRDDYKVIMDTAFEYLNKNNVVPWLDLSKIKEDHMKNRKDYGVAFNILVGLALNLQNEEKEKTKD